MADLTTALETLRPRMRGMPEATIQACAEFQVTGDAAAFRRAVCGVLEHHLARKPAQPVASLPGSTALVAELQLDSLAMVEMVFIFEDVFGVKLAQERLLQVVTLDDLLALLRSELPAGQSSPA